MVYPQEKGQEPGLLAKETELAGMTPRGETRGEGQPKRSCPRLRQATRFHSAISPIRFSPIRPSLSSSVPRNGRAVGASFTLLFPSSPKSRHSACMTLRPFAAEFQRDTQLRSWCVCELPYRHFIKQAVRLVIHFCVATLVSRNVGRVLIRFVLRLRFLGRR